MAQAPWIDVHEWEAVRALLHSEDAEERATGADHVLGLWSSRYRFVGLLRRLV